MITYSIIQKSQLKGACRLDAEYYQPEYLEIVNLIQKIENIPLGTIAQRITQGPNPIFEESGKVSLNGRNIKELRVIEDNSNYVSEQEFEKYKNFKVIQDDILITLKGLGSIGKTGYVFYGIEAIFSRDIGLIRLNNPNLSKFVYVFLLSKYGSKQIERSSTGGTGQLTLATTALKQILIPNLRGAVVDFVALLIEKSEYEYKQSNKLYRQAEVLLLRELDLLDFQVEDDLSFITNFSDVNSASRVDADYFQPKYKELIKRLKAQGSRPLLEFVENVTAKFNPKPDENYQYIELSNIDSTLGTINSYSEVKGKEAPSRARRILKTGDIIISSIEGSFDKVAIVNNVNEDSLASSGFFQIRSRKILPEVLLVLAKSFVLQMQLKQQTAGTILAAVPNEALKKMLVTQLPENIQQQIADLVRKSHQARKKSKELLEEAKRKVEEMIERGGD